MIEVVDNREVNCAGELHLELAERLADNLRAVHDSCRPAGPVRS